MKKGSGYEFDEVWYRFAEDNAEKVKPIHSAIHRACIYVNNKLGWPSVFQMATNYGCHLTGISKPETFRKALKDLSDWGMVVIVSEAKNLYSARYISLDQSPLYKKYLSEKRISTSMSNEIRTGTNKEISNGGVPEGAQVSDTYPNKTIQTVQSKKIKEIVNVENGVSLVNHGDYRTDYSDNSIPAPNAWGEYQSMDELEKVLLSHKSWQADFGKSLGLEHPDHVPIWIEKFFIFCKGSGKEHRKDSDAKSHCQSWTRRQIELGKTIETVVAPKSTVQHDTMQPPQGGKTSGERFGKWIWLNNGWRDTTTFTAAQKRRNGLA